MLHFVRMQHHANNVLLAKLASLRKQVQGIEYELQQRTRRRANAAHAAPPTKNELFKRAHEILTHRRSTGGIQLTRDDIAIAVNGVQPPKAYHKELMKKLALKTITELTEDLRKSASVNIDPTMIHAMNSYRKYTKASIATLKSITNS